MRIADDLCTSHPAPSRDVVDLIALMARLRHPEHGCAWDVAQTFESIAPYTIEEAYEVADAVARGDLVDLRDELGDLLLQVIFQSRIAEEVGAFDFSDVVEAISAKLIRRHPHVFGDPLDLSPADVKALWQTIKAEEKIERARRPDRPPDQPSVLTDVPAGMPALLRAERFARKAAGVGFTWPDAASALEKVHEEVSELQAALQSGRSCAIADELGDVLFTIVNVARLANVDPEMALAGANAKFERRFRSVEAALANDGRAVDQTPLAELEQLWTEAKRMERPDP